MIILGLGFEAYVINLIIGLPVFFILRWIFRKWIKNEKIRKVATWISAIIATPIIYIGLFYLWLSISSFYPTRDFNKAKWDSNPEQRYEMSSDIIKSKMLIDKTKQEAIELLADNENDMENDIWYYNLGFFPRFMAIDPDVLTIKFSNGKVVEVGQHET